jgi:hypothetical protein
VPYVPLAMIDASTSLTVAARTPEPYVHLDNRGLVISNGSRCVMVPAASFRFAAETLEVIAAEDRATRNQHDHILGGYVAGDGVVLFAGPRDDLVSVSLPRGAFDELRRAIAP